MIPCKHALSGCMCEVMILCTVALRNSIITPDVLYCYEPICLWEAYQADQSYENCCAWLKHRAWMKLEGCE
jgi:hypothetical protein